MTPANRTRTATAVEIRGAVAAAATDGRSCVSVGPDPRSDAASASAASSVCVPPPPARCPWTIVLASIAPAATSIRPAKQASRRAGATWLFSAVPAKEAATPANPKPSPAPQRTRPARACPTVATAAVMPTMTRLPVVADRALSPTA